jgi:hypothetical protein
MLQIGRQTAAMPSPPIRRKKYLWSHIPHGKPSPAAGGNEPAARDAQVGEWTRHELLTMDAKFARAMQRTIKAKSLNEGEQGGRRTHDERQDDEQNKDEYS